MGKKRILLSLLCLPLLFSCSPKSDGEWVSFTCNDFIATINNQYVIPFNTQMKLSYFKKNNQEYSETFDNNLSSLYKSSVINLHKTLDRHYDYLDDNNRKVNNVKTINDSYATGEEVLCTDELYDLLKLGYQLTLDTNGYFNFFMGSLTDFWDEILDRVNDFDPIDELDPLYNKERYNEMIKLKESIPTLDEIKNIFTFNDKTKSVTFKPIEDKDEYDRHHNLSLYRPYITSGGISKGYATDLIKKILLDNGYSDGYLNSGSSSITSLSDFTFTKKGSQTISIADPRVRGFQREICFSIDVSRDYSLSTSGNYTTGMSYIINNPDTGEKIYRHHIINPYTGECSQEHASVTLISHSFSNGHLDAFSTAFVNMNTEQGLQFRKDIIKKYSKSNNKEFDLDVIYIDITKDNNLHITLNQDFDEEIKFSKKDYVITYA